MNDTNDQVPDFQTGEKPVKEAGDPPDVDLDGEGTGAPDGVPYTREDALADIIANVRDEIAQGAARTRWRGWGVKAWCAAVGMQPSFAAEASKMLKLEKLIRREGLWLR